MILITGCTGFLGSELIRQLREAGKDVRGFARHNGPFKDPNLRGLMVSVGSILDPQALARAMVGVDQVIHLVGILVETRGQSFADIHPLGTENVLNAAKKAGVNRFIHMSSLGTRPDAKSRYHQTKWQSEEAVRQSGLDFTILRPSVIFGRHDSFTTLFANMARYSPVLPLLGHGDNRMQPVWVEDVARFIVQCLDDSEAVGQTYELGGPEQLTFKEILEKILENTGRHRALVPVPFSLLKLQAAFLERLLPKPPLTRDQLIMAGEDNVTDMEVPWDRYGIQPRRFSDEIGHYLVNSQPKVNKTHTRAHAA
ncbi:MAG: complex I NDUFA9 subunit family protein [Magnetococcales bacterium]|nr:complex I NDUFA9 subunit family protein [Magnetococcales bacterium]MBF0148614.1 complex I NDUFA9 subunit family protein [Magnetococcales bacterium]